MNLSGSYGLVLSDRTLPALDVIQREIDRRPCLFGPRLLVMEPGALACEIRVHDQTFRFGCEPAASDDVIAPADAALARRWSNAFVFRDDGTTIGAALSAMVAEAAARAMDGTLYDRERGCLADYGDLIARLDSYLAVCFSDLDAYYARYPAERPDPKQGGGSVTIAAKVF